MMKGVWKKLLKNEEQFETLLVEQERINDIIEIGKTIIVEPIYFVNLYVLKEINT